jgi:glycosyltransferase involved in cell wall biosynthesis
VHVSELSRDLLRAKYPSHGNRIHAISNGFDPEDLVGLPVRRPADQEVQFLYAGALQGTQDVGRFFEAFGREATASTSIVLVLMGAIEPRFGDAAEVAIGRSHVTIQPGAPHADALRRMATADVLVSFTAGGGAGAATMTGKLYEYIALRRPVLLIGPAGPAADLVARSGAGVVAEAHDLDSIRRAIGEVTQMAADPAFAGASDAVVSVFDRRRLAETWGDVLHSVLVKRSDRASRRPE